MLANCSDAKFDPNKLSWGLCKLSTHINRDIQEGKGKVLFVYFFIAGHKQANK